MSPKGRPEGEHRSTEHEGTSMNLAAALAAAALLLATAQAWAQDAPLRWPAHAAAIRFAPEKDYGPFVYEQADGSVAGLSVDILHHLAQGVGLKLHTLPAATLEEILAGARAGRVDLITSLRPTPERAAFLAFTSPYVTVPAVLVVQAQATTQRLGGLRGQKVAVGKGYAVEAEMRRRHPEVDWRAVPDDVQALRGVVAGQHAAAVVDAASLAFIQRHHGLSGLRATEQVGFDYALSFAVRKDQADLLALLDDGIRRLPARERERLMSRWLEAPPERTPGRAPWATQGAFGLLAASALALAWRLWRRTGAR